MHLSLSNIRLVFLRVFLSLLLCLCFSTLRLTAYGADIDLEIKDAESSVQSSRLSLAEAEAELTRLSAECKVLEQQVSVLQTQINEKAAKVMEAQAKMLDGRNALSTTICKEYKNNSTLTFINLLLGSGSFDDLTKNVQYISQVMDYQSEEVATQRELKENLERAVNELNNEVNSQEAALNSLESKQTEAQNVVARVSDELAANQEKLTSLKTQAEEIKKRQEEERAKVPDYTTPASPELARPATPSVEGWREGLASAYGGQTDPNTNINGLTAFGHVKVTESSMGVAVPMAWENYRSYAGRTVEIKYNGMTVYATVDDCGYMGGGARSLDLQPGVFRAFGATSCYGWGLRTVQYRFL